MRFFTTVAVLLLLLSITFPPPAVARCVAPSFSSSRLTPPGGASVNGLVLADLDLSGTLDLAFSDFNGNRVFVAYGDYTAGLATPSGPSYTTTQPNGLATADFQNDGMLDVVVAAQHSVTIFFNSPGSFTGASFDTGALSQPNAVAVADFNNDGKPDFAVADYNGTVQVWRNGGGTTFTPVALIATGGTPFDIAAADMNRDGKQDLVFTDSTGGTIKIYFGNGTGTFPTSYSYTLAGAPRHFVLGNFDYDGYLDAAVALSGLNRLVVLRGSLSTSDTFSLSANYTTDAGPWGVAAADVTGDGFADLITSNSTAGTVSVFVGVPPLGGFRPAVNFPAGDNPLVVVAGDVTRDGRADILTGNFNSKDVGYLVNNCTSAGGDANGDGSVTVADIFYMVNYLFTGGPAPVE